MDRLPTSRSMAELGREACDEACWWSNHLSRFVSRNAGQMVRLFPVLIVAFGWLYFVSLSWEVAASENAESLGPLLGAMLCALLASASVVALGSLALAYVIQGYTGVPIVESASTLWKGIGRLAKDAATLSGRTLVLVLLTCPILLLTANEYWLSTLHEDPMPVTGTFAVTQLGTAAFVVSLGCVYFAADGTERMLEHVPRLTRRLVSAGLPAIVAGFMIEHFRSTFESFLALCIPAVMAGQPRAEFASEAAASLPSPDGRISACGVALVLVVAMAVRDWLRVRAPEAKSSSKPFPEAGSAAPHPAWEGHFPQAQCSRFS